MTKISKGVSFSLPIGMVFVSLFWRERCDLFRKELFVSFRKNGEEKKLFLASFFSWWKKWSERASAVSFPLKRGERFGSVS